MRNFNQTLFVQNQCQRVLLHAVDEESLLTDFCVTLQREYEHSVVWIGYIEADEPEAVRVVPRTGCDGSTQPISQTTWARSTFGRFGAEMATRLGKPVVCNDIETDSVFGLWRDEVINCGYVSIAVVPMFYEGRTFGLISVYSAEKERFPQEEVELLCNLADDLSSGIQTQRLRLAHTQSKQALIDQEILFSTILDNIPDTIHVLDRSHRLMYVNSASLNLLRDLLNRPELTKNDIIGKKGEEFFQDSNQSTALQKADEEVMATNRSISLLETYTAWGKVRQTQMLRSPIREATGLVVGLVGIARDVTETKAAEDAQRDALVREVHHRVKNSIQGIGGLLRQFGREKPEIAEQMRLVVGHLNGISIIYGMRGRRAKTMVRLCELTREIAQANSTLWQTEITTDIPTNWTARIVVEKDAVLMALVLNELIVNAVKHGGKVDGHVKITLRQGKGDEGVDLTIVNAGHLGNIKDCPTDRHHGLQLVETLSPRQGVLVTHSQHGEMVHTLLQIFAPVLALDTENLHDQQAPPSQRPASTFGG